MCGLLLTYWVVLFKTLCGLLCLVRRSTYLYVVCVYFPECARSQERTNVKWGRVRQSDNDDDDNMLCLGDRTRARLVIIVTLIVFVLVNAVSWNSRDIFISLYCLQLYIIILVEFAVTLVCFFSFLSFFLYFNTVITFLRFYILYSFN